MADGSKPKHFIRVSDRMVVDINARPDLTDEEALKRLEEITPKFLAREPGDYSAEAQDVICEYFELRARLRK